MNTCVAVLGAVLLIACSATATASLTDRSFTATGGTLTYSGPFGEEPKEESATEILTVYSGETIAFQHNTNGSRPVVITGPYTKAGEKYSGVPFMRETLDSGAVWDSEGKSREGYFSVEDAYGDGGWFEMIEHSFTVALAEDRERVQEGKRFRLGLQGNEKEAGVLKLTVEDDDGYSITTTSGTDVYELPVAYTATGFAEFVNGSVDGLRVTAEHELEFDTTCLMMDAAEYHIRLEEYATDAESTVEIAVEERYLTVTCASDDVVLGNEIVVILTSSFYRETAAVTVGDPPDVRAVFNVTLDDEGKKKLKIPTSELGYGTYRIQAELEELQATTYVTITRAGVRVQVPANATVGDLVPVVGDADSGDYAAFVIDGRYRGEVRISSESFAWDWNTRGASAGCQEIAVFILDAPTSFVIGDRVTMAWREENGADAVVSIFLLPPAFSMHAPASIAEGDELVVYGTATGTDHVYLIMITSDGEVAFPPDSVARATPVDGERWEERIADLKSGRYHLLGLHRGNDRVTNALRDGRWIVGESGKTASQQLDILEHAVCAAGSDDLYAGAALSVSSPRVQLTVPATLAREESITITAETNVRDGERAFISLSSSPEILIERSTRVANGTVEACIKCSELLPATYTLRVDIGGRASDEMDIQLVERRENVSSGEAPPATVEPLQHIPDAAEPVDETASTPDGRAEEERALRVPTSLWITASAFILTYLCVRTRKRRW